MNFKSIGIIGTHINPLVSETVNHLFDLLKDKTSIYFENETSLSVDGSNNQSLSLMEISHKCDLAIVVGGDGNFLNAARVLSMYNEIPIIGINRGKLGFLTDINPDQLSTRLLKVLNGEFSIEKRFMMQVQLFTNGEIFDTAHSLNEIVIDSGKASRLFEIMVDVDGHYAYSQRSDGIIIATPTGSTAHALSAGGPIMHPSLNVVVLVPMFSHTLSARPIVLNAESTIKVTIGAYNDPQPILSYDGHNLKAMSVGSYILLKKHDKNINIIHPLDYDYYKSLREKLHWSKMLFD
ncbi:MAG: NAD+ kinase [Francisellaceae bacterium]|jgi:NAD+ kinase